MTTPDLPKRPRQRGKGAASRDHPDDNPPTPANDAGEIVFQGPYKKADLSRWAKLPCWNAVEAACVTCEYEPGPLQRATREELETDPVTLDKIEYRIDLFQRAILIGVLGEQILPMEALRLLDQIDEPFPGLLHEVASRIRPCGKPVSFGAEALGNVVQAIDKIRDGKAIVPRFESKSAQTKVIATLQKMLLGVVIQKLDFDPDRPQNPTAKRVLQAMADAGLPLVDEDTVRDHLRYCVEDHWEGRTK